jgi:hypothetical protein
MRNGLNPIRSEAADGGFPENARHFPVVKMPRPVGGELHSCWGLDIPTMCPLRKSSLVTQWGSLIDVLFIEARAYERNQQDWKRSMISLSVFGCFPVRFSL